MFCSLVYFCLYSLASHSNFPFFLHYPFHITVSHIAHLFFSFNFLLFFFLFLFFFINVLCICSLLYLLCALQLQTACRPINQTPFQCYTNTHIHTHCDLSLRPICLPDVRPHAKTRTAHIMRTLMPTHHHNRLLHPFSVALQSHIHHITGANTTNRCWGHFRPPFTCQRATSGNTMPCNVILDRVTMVRVGCIWKMNVSVFVRGQCNNNK